MRTGLKVILSTLLGIGLASGTLLGQGLRTRASYGWDRILLPPNNNGCCFTPPVNSYFYPSYGFYGGYFSPFLFFPSLPPPTPYMPNYWWTSPYSVADPRQEGYNPSSGYPMGTVATLLLITTPAKARITLDGTLIGTSDSLGPIQLPVGEHSLRVEATGYEPAETILRIEQPVLQQLEIRLDPVHFKPKASPKT